MLSIRHTMAEISGPDFDEATLRSFIGPPLRDSFRDIAGLSGDRLERALEIYIAHQLDSALELVQPYAGIPELIADLTAARVPLAVATSKRTANARMVLENTNLIDAFHIVSGAEPGRMQKRHSIDTAREGLIAGGFDVSNAVMIGDRIHDIDGAAHFDMPCVAVAWGYGTADEWQRADHTVTSVAELRALLLGD